MDPHYMSDKCDRKEMWGKTVYNKKPNRMNYRIKRRPKWLELLGLQETKKKAIKWKKTGLASIIILGITLALCFSDNSLHSTYLSNSHGASRHLLSTDNETAANHGPEWESCTFEETHSKWAWLFNHTVFIFIIFIAIAIVCDDFFVPSLEIISDRLKLSEDVAGATFMAAGSSAPELFSSVAGVAVESDVGVGTIVGSALFNLLIIIALTAALAGQVLTLDWRPLIRDAFFYAMSIGCFIGFVWDGAFTHYESVILLVLYALYIVLMVFNPRLMDWMATWKCCCGSRAIEPVEDGKEKTQETQLNGTAAVADVGEPVERKEEEEEEDDDTMQICPCCPCCPPIRTRPPSAEDAREKGGCWAWFKLVFRWVLFIPAFPFVLLFSWTIPDCSKPHNQKYYILSFVMSVVWIAILSFGMVTLVGRFGCIVGIDSYIMGMVIVAIGTSIPDALSSVLVARDGYGDMAVSNAIGSNVFDINLGLGLPFLIRIAIDAGKPISMMSDQEAIDYATGHMPIITHAKFGFILLLILLIALTVFLAARFKLNKWIGVCFVIIYILFLAYAFTQELYCIRELKIYC